MATLAHLQEDMRRGYLWGATGIMTSGVVWLVAGLVAYFKDPRIAVWALFIGAGFIVPVSNLIDRGLGAPGKHSYGNRLAALALEGTVFMLMCLPLAYALSLYRMEWFFPAVLMIIGGRYLTFGTVYGTPVYWALGALLGVGALAAYTLALPAISARRPLACCAVTVLWPRGSLVSDGGAGVASPTALAKRARAAPAAAGAPSTSCTGQASSLFQ